MTSGPIMLPKKLGHKSTLTENVLLIDPTALLTTTLKPIRLLFLEVEDPTSKDSTLSQCSTGPPNSGDKLPLKKTKHLPGKELIT